MSAVKYDKERAWKKLRKGCYWWVCIVRERAWLVNAGRTKRCNKMRENKIENLPLTNTNCRKFLVKLFNIYLTIYEYMSFSCWLLFEYCWRVLENKKVLLSFKKFSEEFRNKLNSAKKKTKRNTKINKKKEG